MEGLLSVKDIHDGLGELDGWDMRGFDAISKEFKFPSFKAAMEFVNKVAEEAEKMNHHPDITVSYKKVTLSLTTHDAGGLTHRDFKLAKIIEQIILN